MKRNLLFMLLISASALTAQTTHMISWRMGIPSDEANMTIDQGDIVTWTWGDGAPHTVTSQSGPETFASGTLTGAGQEFSHTFTLVGNTAYGCEIHGSMQGIITVEEVLGTVKNKLSGFSFYPNPTTDIVTVTSKNVIDRVEVYDVTGKLVFSAKAATPSVKIYMEQYNAGTYIVKAFSGKEVTGMTVIKE